MVNAAQNATIVVGTDGSRHADRALAWAIDEAKLRGARIHVVSAWHVPAMVYGGPGVVPTTSVPFEETFSKAAENAVAAALERVREAGVDADASVVEGQAADALIDAAAQADLLVVGSRGHGGFVGLLLGSVSGQCAHHAPCPLVIVPSPRDE
jgi:nucleotide-binding universal stress UspA family protein